MTFKVFVCPIFALDSKKTKTKAMDIDIGQTAVMFVSHEGSQEVQVPSLIKLQKVLWPFLISIVYSGNMGAFARANTKNLARMLAYLQVSGCLNWHGIYYIHSTMDCSEPLISQSNWV